jgi:hypothetical protein
MNDLKMPKYILTKDLLNNEIDILVKKYCDAMSNLTIQDNRDYYTSKIHVLYELRDIIDKKCL